MSFSNIPIICSRMQKKKIVPTEISKQDLEAFVLMHICFHREVDQTHKVGGEREREKRGRTLIVLSTCRFFSTVIFHRSY